MIQSYQVSFIEIQIRLRDCIYFLITILSEIENISLQNPLSFHPLLDVSSHENYITDRYLLDMDDAKPVFLCIQRWIEKAKEYYKADTEATEYSRIVQDHAQAYKHLVFFESNAANQAKMYKRRADLLEGLLELLNKTYYLGIVREVEYELGMTYSNILDIKLDALEQTMKTSVPNPHALKKINDLCTKCIKNFTGFVESYYQQESEILKEDLTHDEIIPIAFAYCQIGRLYYKFVTPDKSQQIQHLNNCLKYYKMFIDVCAENKDVGNEMKAEVGVSKEMVYLLPLKIQKITTDLTMAAN